MTIAVLQAETSPSTSYFQFETGRDPMEGMSPISRWLAFSYSFDDQVASVVSVQVQPGARCLRVAHETVTAFTGATALTIGDGAAADGWMATAVADPTTAGNFAVDYDSTFTRTAKIYATGDTIDISFAGIATAGTGRIYIEMLSFSG